MSFPWAANINTLTYRKRDRERWLPARLPRKSLGWFVALALSGVAQCMLGQPANAAPFEGMVPGGGQWTGAKVPVPDTETRTLTVEQTQSKAYLNWSKLNIVAGERLHFEQQSSSWIVLNHIHDLSPSTVNGAITAKGGVYLINQNGILFGSGAQVDTHTFVASTLDIDDQIFNNGMADAINQGQGKELAAFVGTGTGYIQIDAGALLKTDGGGSIMLLAPRIDNAGEINTPGGQAILAASQDKVYLANFTDVNSRGMLVEVATGGDVSNLGRIIAERGNVSIIGHAVNQNGIVRATMALDVNGSIRLLARDGATVDVNPNTNIGTAKAYRTGELKLGEGSLTEVAADNTVQTALDLQQPPPSQIELMGNEVTLMTGARIVAPAGNVTITATRDPDTKGPSPLNLGSNSRFLMTSGSSIDVSGLNSAVLPMERNSVAVELRGSQLADSPLQRNGPLYGKTVYLDVRKGTPLANVKADLVNVDRPLDERLAVGGKVTIVSDDKVVMQKNSVIDVSGGSIRYEDGFVNTSKLVSQGKVVDISNADPNRPYDGIYSTYNVTHRKWGVTESFNASSGRQFARFDAGYVEGKDAGSVAINARNLDSPDALGGVLRGEVTAGRYQRLPQTDLTGIQRLYNQLPLGGGLLLGDADTRYSGLNDYTLRSPAALGASGFNRMWVYARGNISLSEGESLVLSPGGDLGLTGTNVDVQGNIVVHGGNVTVNALGSSTSLTRQPDGPNARLGTKGRIDVSGQWVNDGVALQPGVAPQDPVFIHGGKVKITANGNLDLQAGSLVDASGGAHLQRDGTLQYGKGGDIVITDLPAAGNINTGKPPTLQLDGEVRAYSFGKGGSLSLTGAGFRIGGQQSEAPLNTLHLDPGFFQRGGFSAYNLTSTHTGISIAQNTDVLLRPMNRVLGPQFNTQATGTDLNQLGGLIVPPDFQQQPVSLALSLDRAANVASTVQVEMEKGSGIFANPGANISLSSDTNLIVDGTIAVPAGNILLSLSKPKKNDPPANSTPPPQTIRLGPQGQLLAGAIYQPAVDTTGRGLRLGTVRDGGTVSVAASTGDNLGYFIASSGSHIDVSGTTQTLDVTQGVYIKPTAVNGAAGAINLSAAEGMALNGSLTGAAGTGPGAAGGTLSVSLGVAGSLNGSIALTEQPTKAAPGLGDTDLSKLKGQVEISTGMVRDGGFDSLALHSMGRNNDPAAAPQISLVGDVDLTMKGRLVLDTPLLTSQGGQAKLAASSLVLGPEGNFNQADIRPGQGSVRLSGQHVDIKGALSLSGFGPRAGDTAGSAPIEILSDGDIRLIGGAVQTNADDAYYAGGGLYTMADATLRSDQVYTASETDYTVSAKGSTLRIQPGGVSETPLSAGSRLTLMAENIEQNGTVRAPFGQIVLDAKNNLLLDDGSVTSVSGAGQTVPFGTTELGQDWVYQLAANTKRLITAPPEKLVSLTAPQVTLAPGSVVDVTGGGDLAAREQFPGPGGSVDILDAAHANGAFAIVPTRTDLYGSYDPFLSAASTVKPGDTITIAAGGPIPTGQYAMLPAGYALLPGAYLITPLAKSIRPIPGQAIPQFSGASIVAGQRSDAGTGAHDSLWSAFLMENGAQVRSRAEYLESRADTFFAANGGRLNRDAGRLVVHAAANLTLGGTLASNAAGGFGSEVDIVARKLAVVNAYTGASDRVELLDAGLNNLNADSLLLGATRTYQGADVAFNVQATDVTVESGTTLAAPEVMLAASNQVQVADNATIRAAGSGRVGSSGSILLDGDSALARVSSGEQVRVQRAAAGTQPMQGTLDIAVGAKLDAARSITLDASLDTKVDGDINTHDGSLSLAASRISMGDTQMASGGLVLSNDRLAQMHASELMLNSRSTIDLYGAIALNIQRVALDAAGLAGGSGQNASITAADTIALSNRFGYAYPDTASPSGSGTLDLTAPSVTLGAGDFHIRGFSNTTVAATDQIIGQPETDTAAKLHVAGDLTLQTARLTASKGADVLIDTHDATGAMVGKMTLTAPAVNPDPAAKPPAPVTDLGAKLELAATQIYGDTHIELPSGIVRLHATGAAGLQLGDNASIDVAGRDVTFADYIAGSSGGAVSLTADQGNVVVGAQARIDVSGAPSGGDAGQLSINAPLGSVQLDPAAQILATAQAGGRTGSFALDAWALAGGFSPLNATLNATGFNDVRQLRLRHDNVTIAAADTVLAHDLRIAADAGRIDVFGHIDASGTQAGQVALYARDDVSLHAASRIDAYATGAGEQGGSVTLGSDAGPEGANTPGRLDLQAGAQINVAGTDEAGVSADTGSVHLRAARMGTNGVSTNPIAATIAGAGRVDMEAYKTYTATSIDNGLIATVEGEANAYMANAAASIKSALGVGNDTRFHLLAGIEIDSPDDLALNTSWDLHGLRPGGEAGVLSLRAAGNLNLNNNLSDGVASVSVEGIFPERDTPQTGASWSYRLAAGADLNAADPLAVRAGVGDIALASSVKVRTGTGDIDIAAGKDLRLADSGADIYTMGENRGAGGVPATDSLSADVTRELVYGADFLKNGGNVRIDVGGDIHGADGHQLVNEWLSRAGGANITLDIGQIDLPASWAVNSDKFQQNIGALGGGDVTIIAAGDINNLSVAIPTTGQPMGGYGTAPSIAGGGDLLIVAGGDVRGGVFYLARGRADIRVGGSVTRGVGGPTDASVYPVLALGDGQYSVRARKNLGLETILNPTALPQSLTQGTPDYPLAAGKTYFFTYTPDSAAQLESVSGDVLLNGDTVALGKALPIAQLVTGSALSYYPGSLSARSLQGDIILGGTGFTLLPAPRGDLELLAGGSIIPGSSSTTLLQLDSDPTQIPSSLAPATDLSALSVLNTSLDPQGTNSHAAIPVHRGDTQPERIIAQTGDIGTPLGSDTQLILSLPKQTRLYAGGDVRNLMLSIQHVDSRDISVIEAGGSVIFPTGRNPISGKLNANSNGFKLAGPGQLYVLAGRDVDLAASEGIQSIGNQNNKALPDSGAGISVMTGLAQAPDYAAFIDQYLVKQDTYSRRLAQYMGNLGVSAPVGGGTLVERFRALPLLQQRELILDIFFNELRESGIAAGKSLGGPDYSRGFAAIQTLFPAGPYPGDLKSYLSQIYTRKDGDINIVVPGGLINAGVASSATGIFKQADQLGIVALGAGNVNAFVNGDFLVNSSRVYALDGGDVLMWSSVGNIDAGKGAKTALSIPSPVATHDKDGNTFLEFPPSVSGSGIRADVHTPGREPGNVYLIAPQGVVNAGDAGIGTAGDLTIAATAVIGADNIKVGGISVGVPTDTAGLGAGLAGVGDLATTTSKAAEDAASGLNKQQDEDRGFLGVEVIGFGE